MRVRASREATKRRKGDGRSGERREDGGRQWCERESGRKREKEREGQRDGRRFALRRDRKRDSLGLVIYLKRSRAPCATRPGGPKLRRIVFSTRPNVRRNRGGDGDDDGDDENDPFSGGERGSGAKNTRKIIVTPDNTTVWPIVFVKYAMRIDAGFWRSRYRAK